MTRSPARGLLLVALALAALLFGARPVLAEASAPTIAVVETRAVGVSPEAASAVTRQLYATVARLGHRAAPEAAVQTAAARFSPNGPIPAEVLAAARELHVDRAVVATLAAESGRYRLTLLVAAADGTGPWIRAETADAATLESITDQAFRAIVPPAPPPGSGAASEARSPVDPSAGPGLRLAVQTEGAFGLSGTRFYNHLLGARLDYGFSEDVALGGYLGYVNLKGKEGRASNVLPYLMLEYRLHGSGSSRLRIPIRFSSGYLPKNGPFLRLSAGLSFPIGETTRLGFDLLAPTLWIAQNRTVYSLDVAAEVSFAL